MKPATWLLAAVLAVLTVVGLSASHQQVGYARDEGIYFDASRSYGAWLLRLAKDPQKSLSAKVRDRHFAPNHEHPAMMKMLAGLSAAAVAKPAGSGKSKTTGVVAVLDEGAAMRLPAQLFAGFGVGLLFFAAARRHGVTAGFIAAGTFILLPRVWFHAGLHAFDVPVAVATLAVVLAYRRAQRSTAWALALGPMLGFAIAVKHNALFIGPLLALHYYGWLLLERLRGSRRITVARLLPLPLVSMAVLAPLCAFALWPWLWSDPVGRFTEYMEFHRQHSWYNMEFLGVNYNQPPMPASYPFVLTLATVPLVVLAVGVLGLGLATHNDLRTGPNGDTHGGGYGTQLGLFTLAPLLLIAWPYTPIFGGTKHWITAYPFLSLAAAEAWGLLWKAAKRNRHTPILQVLGLGLVLGPPAVATIDGHPYNLSQYSAVVGGPRGAADLGLGRGFWGHAVVGLLPTIHASGEHRLHLHDLHELARRQYQREGRWPLGAQPSSIPKADAALLFHERHMATYETQIWNAFGTTAPSDVVTLDDVPLTSHYVAHSPD